MLVPLHTLHIFIYYAENQDLNVGEAWMVVAAANAFRPRKVLMSHLFLGMWLSAHHVMTGGLT